DGDAGATVPCDGNCNQFAGRRSVFIVGSAAQHCVTYFEDSACHTLGGLAVVNGDSCANVNTGTQVNSFKCSSNDVCLGW
ncbi:hypothetical protein CPC08DRAFT_641384, partial [Agrocybe pediades]